MRRIRIEEIASMPVATVTSRDFDKVNICWLKTIHGQEFEVLFNRDGEPLTDQSLIARIERFFNKQFRQMRIEDDLVFGMEISARQIHDCSRSEKATAQKYDAQTH